MPSSAPTQVSGADQPADRTGHVERAEPDESDDQVGDSQSSGPFTVATESNASRDARAARGRRAAPVRWHRWVQQDQPGDLGRMAAREQPSRQTAERVSDEHVGRRDPGGGEQCVKFARETPGRCAAVALHRSIRIPRDRMRRHTRMRRQIPATGAR